MSRRLLIVMVAAAVVVGCSRQPEAPKRAPDNLLVGVAPDHPPFAYMDTLTGATVGFDIELMSLICLANRWRCEIRPTPGDSLLTALRRGDIDIAVAGSQSDTGAEDGLAFSDPYYLTGRVLLVPSGDSLTAGLEELPGRRVAVCFRGSDDSLRTQLDKAQVRALEDLNRAVADLEAGQLDAIVADFTVARRTAETHPAVRIVPGMLSTEYYVMAMRVSDTLRLKRLNNALASLLGGYSYERLHVKWFGYPLLNIAVPDSVSARWDAE